MKKYAKKLVVKILGWQVRRLRGKADFKVIAVAGSIGKTSTKFAVATVLSEKFKVRWQKGNYNDTASVPLVYFGLPLPSLFNPLGWFIAFLKNELQISRNYPYEIVVVEIGTDFPGNIAQFKKYVRADIGVLTAITPEHMEFFADLDAVAAEELTLAEMADTLLVNTDLCDTKYLGDMKYVDYGGSSAHFMVAKKHQPSAPKTQLYSIAAAVAVAKQLDMDDESLRNGILNVKPVSGRMRQLQGIKNSTILDDTYNASPEAARSALDTLYGIDAPQRIALLGNMNELGDYSRQAHEEVGAYCEPKKLDLVVTLGLDSNEYLAAAAEAAGCKVVRTETPYQAADEIAKVLQKSAVILAKGSQNGVFAEEAVKKLLANPDDANQLVRQSDYWMKQKQKSFKRS